MVRESNRKIIRRSLVSKHKQGQIQTRELLVRYMKLTNKHELPRNLRH